MFEKYLIFVKSSLAFSKLSEIKRKINVRGFISSKNKITLPPKAAGSKLRAGLWKVDQLLSRSERGRWNTWIALRDRGLTTKGSKSILVHRIQTLNEELILFQDDAQYN